MTTNPRASARRLIQQATIATPVSKRPPASYYVELAGEDPETNEHLLFRGVLVYEAQTPNEAVRIAIEESPAQMNLPLEATAESRTLRAIKWDEFMSRRLNEKRARKIESAIKAGTWEGWPFGSEARNGLT